MIVAFRVRRGDEAKMLPCVGARLEVTLEANSDGALLRQGAIEGVTIPRVRLQTLGYVCPVPRHPLLFMVIVPDYEEARGLAKKPGLVSFRHLSPAEPAGKPEGDVDFVFLDAASRPWRAKTWGNNGAWLFYWHEAALRWVSLRGCSEEDVRKFREGHLLSDFEASLYHDLAKAHGGD